MNTMDNNTEIELELEYILARIKVIITSDGLMDELEFLTERLYQLKKFTIKSELWLEWQRNLLETFIKSYVPQWQIKPSKIINKFIICHTNTGGFFEGNTKECMAFLMGMDIGIEHIKNQQETK